MDLNTGAIGTFLSITRP